MKENKLGLTHPNNEVLLDSACLVLYSFLFFSIVNFSVLQIQKVVFPKLDKKDMVLYNSCVVGNVHHILITSFTVYNHFNLSCDWYNDDVCMLTPFPNFRRSIMFTTGYLVYDFIVIVFICEHTNLTMQMVFHHIIGTTGCWIGMHAGYGQASIGTTSLMMEVSTIFMNYRTMLSAENVGRTITDVNQILFFLTFTVFRIILMPYLIYRFYFSMLFSWNYMTFTRQCACIFSLL
jgi:hypothetical protein